MNSKRLSICFVMEMIANTHESVLSQVGPMPSCGRKVEDNGASKGTWKPGNYKSKTSNYLFLFAP